MIVSSEIIVLNSKKYGDSSKIISAFSLDYGKISFIAKGARMPKNKFGSSLEPLSNSIATFYLKPNTELYLLSKCEIATKRLKLYQSNEHLTAGFMILETVSKTQLQKNQNEELYYLLNSAICELNKLSHNPFSIVINFFCNFAQISGFELNIDNNLINSQQLTNISIDTGTILDSLYSQNLRTFKLSNTLASKLYELSILDCSECSEIEINQNEFTTLNNFFTSYFSYHLDFNFVLKSSNIL